MWHKPRVDMQRIKQDILRDIKREVERLTAVCKAETIAFDKLRAKIAELLDESYSVVKEYVDKAKAEISANLGSEIETRTADKVTRDEMSAALEAFKPVTDEKNFEQILNNATIAAIDGKRVIDGLNHTTIVMEIYNPKVTTATTSEVSFYSGETVVCSFPAVAFGNTSKNITNILGCTIWRGLYVPFRTTNPQTSYGTISFPTSIKMGTTPITKVVFETSGAFGGLTKFTVYGVPADE